MQNAPIQKAMRVIYDMQLGKMPTTEQLSAALGEFESTLNRVAPSAALSTTTQSVLSDAAVLPLPSPSHL